MASENVISVQEDLVESAKFSMPPVSRYLMQLGSCSPSDAVGTPQHHSLDPYREDMNEFDRNR
jgi:hypothetical protein